MITVMRRFAYILALLALVLSACGASTTTTTSDDGDTQTTVGGEATASSSTTESPDVGEAPDGSEGTPVDETVAPVAVTDFDGPVAADFSIDLDSSGPFTLSEEARPVYLVFWAEW